MQRVAALTAQTSRDKACLGSRRTGCGTRWRVRAGANQRARRTAPCSMAASRSRRRSGAGRRRYLRRWFSKGFDKALGGEFFEEVAEVALAGFGVDFILGEDGIADLGEGFGGPEEVPDAGADGVEAVVDGAFEVEDGGLAA
jgi:hypothetical protein